MDKKAAEDMKAERYDAAIDKYTKLMKDAPGETVR